MRLHKQALFLANIQLGQGSMEARAILTACDRLNVNAGAKMHRLAGVKVRHG